MIALDIINVSKNYGSFKALNDINFKIEAGEFVGLLGINGAGKTSLISSISGVTHFEGKIKIMGHDIINQVVKAKKNLGVVPQEIAYDQFLTVYQTLKFQSGLYGVKNNKEWMFEVIERMHLTDKVDTNVRALSGGMKRRLMVAQALVHKPPVIVLDEPTVGVDVEIRKDLWDFIRELHQKCHTILLTSHYLEEIEKLCNKIIIIDKGRILAQDSKSEFMNKSSLLPTTVQIQTLNNKFASELNNLILKQEGNIFTLQLNNNDQLLLILNALQTAQVKIENIQIIPPSLEQIFINRLGR